ncbi:MAG: hypothetical protein PHQ75_01930 [Thermoguttaceae bacterium]|nr:hypothetical protein [Thermoguttaceae bacterium]
MPIEPRLKRSLIPWAEVVLVFGLLWLFGGWPVPDVNEQYYIGKAIHFWHPEYLPADQFLDTQDSHWFFYATFGIFSFLFSPTALAWFGRLLAWALTAWSWQRLSQTIIDCPWVSVLTAMAFLFYIDVFHLAGEWLVGGVEGKSFAFPLVFLGLAAFLRGQFNRCWIYLGAASAFHVLVGGWTVLACLVCWSVTQLRDGCFLRSLRNMLPGLAVGGFLSLIGLVPAVALDAGTSAQTVREAHRIYVFERLSHHLVPSALSWTFLFRFGLLAMLWICFGRLTLWRRDESEQYKARDRRFDGFVLAAISFAMIGMLFDFGSLFAVRAGWLAHRDFMAGLLRFYWFRLSDWVVPLGTAFGFSLILLQSGKQLFCRHEHGVSEMSEKNEKNEKNEMSGTVGRVIIWLVVGCVVYAIIKSLMWDYSLARAKALTVDPDYPVIPVAVEASAFPAALLITGWIACLFSWLKFRRTGVTLTSSGVCDPIVCCFGLMAFVLVGLAPLDYAANRLNLRCSTVLPRSNPPKESISDGWLDVCRWIADPAHTDPNAVFLVPRGCDSFKWNSHRAMVGAWKEIPQDAASIVKWYRLMEEMYAFPGEKGVQRWNQPLVMVLIAKGRARILQECQKEKIDYIVIENPPYVIASHPEALKRYQEFYDNDLAYQNSQFTVLRIKKSSEQPSN